MLQYFALEGHPNEVCGILHHHDIIHQYANTFYGDHRRGFDMEVDIVHSDIKAIWHSHPGGLASPSRDDIQCMEELAGHGHSFPWIIITNKIVTVWELELETTLEIQLR